MKSIQGRLNALEKKLNAAKVPETIEDLVAAMERGEYKQTSMMAIVTSIMAAGGADHLKGRFPDELVSWLVHVIEEPRPALFTESYER